MTSDSSHYWRGDSNQPDDFDVEAESPRGFGLFEAPPAPSSEDVPAFRPLSSSSSSWTSSFGSDDLSSDNGDLPSSSTTFSGFPSDDPLTGDLPGSHYVPAPAAMPIPGVRHDPDSGPSSSWTEAVARSSYDEPSFDSPSFDSPSFDRPSFDSSLEPPSFERPSFDSSLEPPSFERPTFERPSFEPPSVERPSFDRPSLDRPSFDRPPVDRSKPDTDEPVSGSWAAFAAGESSRPPGSGTEWNQHSPSSSGWGQPSPPAADWNHAAPASGAPASPSSGWHQAGADSAPPAAPTSPARASVSIPNRVAPSETPPAPADPNKPVGRVYGSAAAAPESSAPVSPPPATMPGQPTSGVRATARASIPVARPEPGDAPPPATRSSTVYGSTGAALAAPGQDGLAPAGQHPAQAGYAPAVPPTLPPTQAPPGQPPRQGRPHAYGDLLGPAGGAPAHGPFAEAAMAPPPLEAPGILGHRTPDGPPQFHAGPSMTMPPGARTGGPMAPPRGPMTPPQPDEAKPERKGRIILGVLVVSVALLAAAFGGLTLVAKLFNGSTFAVGDCVKQSDSAAVKVDCGEANSFKVTAVVGNPEQCQDQTQPHVQQGTQYFCLAPAAGTQVTPTGTPEPTATPTK